MRNPAKAILVALLIAIPAPLVLALLLSFTPEPLRLIAVGEFVEALGSTRGIAAYIITFIVFGIAGFWPSPLQPGPSLYPALRSVLAHRHEIRVLPRTMPMMTPTMMTTARKATRKAL